MKKLLALCLLVNLLFIWQSQTKPNLPRSKTKNVNEEENHKWNDRKQIDKKALDK